MKFKLFTLTLFLIASLSTAIADRGYDRGHGGGHHGGGHNRPHGGGDTQNSDDVLLSLGSSLIGTALSDNERLMRKDSALLALRDDNVAFLADGSATERLRLAFSHLRKIPGNELKTDLELGILIMDSIE